MSLIFHAKTGNGGYGDRLVGLVTAYFLSEIMEKKFYINWESPKINNFVDIEECPLLANNRHLILIDNRAFNLTDLFLTKNLLEEFPDENILLWCNQNMIKFLYKNPNYPNLKIENYESDIKNIYDKIYTEFLKPKDSLLNIVNPIIEEFKNYNKILGIHIRTGDINMGVGNHILYNKNSLEDIIEKICIFLDNKYDAIFVTSDFPNVNLIFEKYLPNIKIFYHNLEIIHIDMIKQTDDIYNGTLKLFADHYTLCMCTDTLTHKATNFGKTASLINNGKRLGINYYNFIDEVSITDLATK